MNKQALRELYKAKRQALSDEERMTLSQEIYHKVLPLIAPNKLVSIFLPIEKHKEINTWQLIDTLKPSQIVVSRSNFENHSMEHFFYENRKQIAENSWGIPEPTHGKQVDVSEIDIVIVPLLIGDLKGNRVGYGKGFYDRFLASCNADVLKIGINFFEPIEKIEGALETDVPLNYYISPNEVYSFELL